jgi:predicted TIM-barrel fold metal-dependent hydrolase
MMKDVWSSSCEPILDGHVHMGSIDTEPLILDVCEAAGIDQMNLVSIQDAASGSGLAQSLYMKAMHPRRFYVFAGLNHAEKLTEGAVSTPSLVDQVDQFVAMGCDGIKMIEGKPTSRQKLDIRLDAPYYEDYWARVEELQIPLVWHVNDPEEFWDPARIPDWAKERNWGYGPEDVAYEQLYEEVDNVLARYPDLHVIFAHFYFLSADLARAMRFLEAHPTVCFDLTPGIEMLHNLSTDVDASRDFFLTYADRIVFGTDISSRNTLEEARIRAGLVYRWLETEDAFPVPEAADFLLGGPEDGLIQGMALPEETLAAIYRKNFVRLTGPLPKALAMDEVVAGCRQIAGIAEAMSGTPEDETEAGRVAELLSKL